MRIEEQFGGARKKPEQSISQWIGYIRSLAGQLRDLGTNVPAERVANRILNGLGSEYSAIRYALRARSGALSVEIVTQHLLAVENDRKEEEILAGMIVGKKEGYDSIGRHTKPGSLHGPTATAMAAQERNTTQECSNSCGPSCSCQTRINIIDNNGQQQN